MEATAAWNATMRTLTASYSKEREDVQGRVALLRRELGAAAS